jgi:hypothetical protein
MVRPSCTHREFYASFVTNAVKTQQAVEIRVSSRVKYWMLGLNDR